jgi:glycosyltransferase involved in cell wall biosynthesis
VRIAFVVNQLALGGAERQVADLAKALVRRGHACTLFYFYGKSLLRDELDAAGVTVERLDAGRTYWRGVPTLRRELRRREIDVVNTHMPLPGIFGRIAAWTARVPCVHTEQLPLDRERPLIRLANELTLNAVPHLICISDEVRRTVHPRLNWYLLHRQRVHVIKNSIDVSRLEAEASSADIAETRRGLGLRPDDIVIVNVGRYHEQKGQTYLLKAMRVIVAHEPRVKLVVVGWGSLEQALRAEVHDLGLDDQVVLAVERADAYRIVAAGDLFVFPSLYEGLGIALLEAMLAGKPVVATDIPPLTEVVRRDVDGVLVPAADPDAIASAVLDLLSDPERMRALGTVARAHVREQFGIDRAASAYEKVFSGVVGTSH